MNELRQTLTSVTRQLRANALICPLLLAASAYLTVVALTGFLGAALLAGLASLVVGAFLTKPFEDKKTEAIRLIHQLVGDAEYSLPLLSKPQPNIAEQLQLERLSDRVRGVRVPGVLWAPVGRYGLGLLLAVAVYAGLPRLRPDADLSPEKRFRLAALVSDSKPALSPTFRAATVQIQPPAYTRLPVTESADLNVVALAGSQLKWQVRFSHARNLRLRLVDGRGQEKSFQATGDGFMYHDRLTASGLYALKAYWRTPENHDSLVYQSDFYRLEATPDLAPKIEPESKELYRFHAVEDPKTMAITARIFDDFAVATAFVVATVARGSGENVKFREVRIPLEQTNFRQAKLTKTLDLKALNFAPGDELYYYWAAVDNRRPEPNFTKSDTYFLVYKDTTQVEESELATMAVNIMPEYFRSQRQIIIDTEKLIAQRKRLAARPGEGAAFKSKSNEIGFDQKALRLRYGQFLGEEFEKSIGGGDAMPTDGDGDVVVGFAAMQQYMHKHDTGEGDQSAGAPAQATGHKHDGHDHGGGPSSPADKDPVAALMEQYVHAHDNAETNTFHEQSTRSLLKMALEQMWQSELHLRLYEPEKALPFEQKALSYLKLSQQKARSYVKKTGFDPPPIKENELRLTGELKNMAPTFSQQRTTAPARLLPLVADVLGYLDGPPLRQPQRQTVQQLGNLIANDLISSGLANWSVLSLLQKLAGGRPLSVPEKRQLKTNLYRLTGTTERTVRSYSSNPTLERSFWKQLK